MHLKTEGICYILVFLFNAEFFRKLSPTCFSSIIFYSYIQQSPFNSLHKTFCNSNLFTLSYPFSNSTYFLSHMETFLNDLLESINLKLYTGYLSQSWMASPRFCSLFTSPTLFIRVLSNVFPGTLNQLIPL